MCVRCAMISFACSSDVNCCSRVTISLVVSAAVSHGVVDLRDVSCHEVVAAYHGPEGSDQVDVVFLLSADGRERVT